MIKQIINLFVKSLELKKKKTCKKFYQMYKKPKTVFMIIYQ